MVVANGLSAAFALVYVAVLGRLLPPSEYGAVTAALSLLFLFSLVTNPFETAIAGEFSRLQALQDRVGMGTVLRSMMLGLRRPAIVAVVALFLIAVPLSRWLHLESPGPMLWLGVLWLISVPASLVRGALRGAHRFGAYGASQVAESAARCALGTVAVYAGGGASGALAGYALGLGAGLLWSWIGLRDLPPGGEAARRSWSGMTASAPSLLFGYFFLTFVANADVIAAKRLLSPTEAGLYGAAASLARVVYLVATPVYQMVFAATVSATAVGRSSRRTSWIAFSSLGAALLVGCAVAYGWSEELLHLVFGERYRGGGPVFAILFATTSLLALEAVALLALLGGEPRSGTRLLLVPCAVMLLAIVLSPPTPTALALCSTLGTALGMPVLFLINFPLPHARRS